MKHIAILGSTGSIGLNTLDVIRRNPLDFKVTGLSANSNISVLLKQIKEFSPFFVCVKEVKAAELLKKELSGRVKVFSGENGLLDMLEEKPIDQVVLAVSGSGALLPLLKSIDTGRDIALANKEALVMAGPIVMNRARNKKVKIIPVDSEHSAIWQCLEQINRTNLRYIYLTASGGPFRRLEKNNFKKISVKDALTHPRWIMGKKITVDSATLMNKGLEFLEAVYLFGIRPEAIKIVIHPESIIHSMVEYVDGAILAQLSIPDMRIPIQYALTYPLRMPSKLPGVDFFKLKQLNFERPDLKKFPCLGLAFRAAEMQGTMPCVLNAANEVGVAEFLKQKISFVSIAKIIDKVLDKHKNMINPDLNDVFAADDWARQEAHRIISKMEAQ